MRNAVNVQVALFLATVSLTASLVTAEKLRTKQQDVLSRSALYDEAYVEAEVLEEESFAVASEEAEEHSRAPLQEKPPAAVHRAAALLQSGQNALREEQRQRQVRLAEVDTAFQVALKQALAQEETSLAKEAASAKAKAAEEHRRLAVASQVHIKSTLSQTASSAKDQAEIITLGTSHSHKKAALVAKTQHENLWLTGIFAKIDLSHFLGKKTQVQGAQQPQRSLPQGPPQASRLFDIRGKLEAWRSEFLVKNHEVMSYVVKGFISILVWAALIMLLGIFYHHEKQHPPQLDPEGVNVSLHDRERMDRHRWRFGLFECMEVPSLCFTSLFCAPLRWADTMRMAGFMNYFAALAMVVGLTVLGFCTVGLGFVILLAVVVHYRQQLRKKYEINTRMWGVGSYMTDLLAYVFCPVCSVVQEARQMEEAYLARHASVHGSYFRIK